MRSVERLGWMLSGALLCLLLLFGCSLEDLTQQETSPTARAKTEQTEPPRENRSIPEATPAPDRPVGAPATQLDPLGDTINNVYQKVNQSVVLITVSSSQGGGLGTGFVYDKQGHIVTNAHVIAGRGAEIVVSFPNQEDYFADVVGFDQDADLAVLRVRDIDPDLLVPVELGDSSELRVGQLAVAIGNPLGEERTVTVGIISAVRAAKSETNNPRDFLIPGVIQTDAAINPGNSGGPLLDASGRVIGVNTFIANPTGLGGNIGIGFAVPVNLVKKVVPAIIETGEYVHPYLGIGMNTVSRLQAQEQNLPAKGILIVSVAPGGPAANAGIQQGDIIKSINGQEVPTSEDLIAYLEFNTEPGDEVTIAIIDPNGEQREVTVEIGARPRR